MLTGRASPETSGGAVPPVPPEAEPLVPPTEPPLPDVPLVPPEPPLAELPPAELPPVAPVSPPAPCGFVTVAVHPNVAASNGTAAKRSLVEPSVALVLITNEPPLPNE